MTTRRSLAWLICCALPLWAACGSSEDPTGGEPGMDAPDEREPGQSDFISAPPHGGDGLGLTQADNAGGEGAPTNDASGGRAADSERSVEETDLYRLEGDRLYFLNGYRGLMVFDVSDLDQPRLLGRSPIFGWPVEMIVRDGIATVVVADWYGTMDDGQPFHGSIVRGIDARDPADMTILGEAKLGGWVRDTRVVGDVIYAVSEESDWNYFYDYASGSCAQDGVSSDVAWGGFGSTTVVSSVSFAGGQIETKGRYEAPGWGGIFHVTSSAILAGHDIVPEQTDAQGRPRWVQPTHAALVYIDISDPGGEIVERGRVEFQGTISSWGTDNGRWNLDFADGQTAKLLACGGPYCGGSDYPYLLLTADFGDPDAPEILAQHAIAGSGWSPAARFDGDRMYLAPSSAYWWGNAMASMPIEVYDLSDPSEPMLAGQTSLSGTIWNFTPSGDRLFALGDMATDQNDHYWDRQIAVSYLDVSDVAAPEVLGTASFGEGWAWTPAAGTFKAFTKDDEKGLVVLPFSGWSYAHDRYNNGVQIIEFTDDTIRSAGAAHTRGWVERGIFVRDRLVSLSNLALAVIDYTDIDEPQVVAELTLARNVIDAQPNGDTIAQLSSDWWHNDTSRSELRVLPLAHADEHVSGQALVELEIEGTDARIFHDGELSYVVSNVRHEIECDPNGNYYHWGEDAEGNAVCYAWSQQVQVVDRSQAQARLRGKLELPRDEKYYYYGGGGWFGCYPYDWYHGSDVVQVGGNKLAFRRWQPVYGDDGRFEESRQALFVVNLEDPDAPRIGNTTIVRDETAWWGNLRAIGDQLYTTHYEWVERPSERRTQSRVRYFVSRIDLSDANEPRVAEKINVPGLLVGGSEADPSILYTIDYRWAGNDSRNDFHALRIEGDKAYLLSSLSLPGWVGNTFVRGDRAYMSLEAQIEEEGCSRYETRLYQLDLSDPEALSAQHTVGAHGWGWLVGVEGDRALVTSGWSGHGVDIYRLDGDVPSYDRFVRTQGWWPGALSRQGDQLFISSGHWGVQVVDLD